MVARVAVAAMLLLGVLGGCRAPAPSPSLRPAAPAWPTADVEQPADITALPSGPDTFCAPCHPGTITQMRDVVWNSGRWLAIGSQTPLQGVIWTSTDGRRWTIRPSIPEPAGKVLNSIAADRRRVVVVGNRVSAGPAAWWSDDGGGRWQQARVDGAGEGAMLAVIATHSGFVAGGYLGPPFGAAHRAAFWISPDGRWWTRVPDAPAFTSGHVSALAVTDTELVAVGSAGDPQHGPAVSWVSQDGRHWQRSVPAASLGNAVMLSVTAWKAGVVAVGRSADGGRAVAWSSSDGLRWRRAPDAPSLESIDTYAPHAEMAGLIATRQGLIAVGWNSSPSNGTAVIWTSADGLSWTRERDEAGLAGGGMSALAAGPGLVVAVGSSGWPDSHVATVWRHRLPG